MKILTRIFLLLILPTLLYGQQKKAALLVGNSNYASGMSLANPVNDVNDIAQQLALCGFDVTCKTDLTQNEMKRVIDEWGSQLQDTDVGLFFYAGHGVQTRGQNFLVPVDAVLQTENDVEYNCVNTGRLLAKMEAAGTSMNLIMLDACRNNPFERSWSRKTNGAGLAFMTAPRGSLIAYSTTPGKTASDGNQRNSPYAKAVLKYMMVPDLKIEDFFKLVRKNVRQNTHEQQVPWESTSLEGDFYFMMGDQAQEMTLPFQEAEIEAAGNTVQRQDIVSNDPDDYETYRKKIASQISSIAILPFANYSGNDANVYLAEGMHDALITELGKLGNLRVTSRTSTLSYANMKKNLKEIASELSVEGLIETSMIEVAKKIRIQVKLYSIFPEEQLLWTEVFNSDLSDIFALFDHVIKNIADKVQITLTPEQESDLSIAEKVDPEAYKTYVIGRHYWNKFGPDDLDKALDYFEQAIEIDDQFALAYIGVSDALYGKLQLGFAEDPEATIEKINASLAKAEELNNKLPEIYYTKANMYASVNWDWELCESEFMKVFEINPNYGDAYAAYCNLLQCLGRNEESLYNGEKAMKLDPNNNFTKILYSAANLFAGNYQKSVQVVDEVLELEPTNFLGINLLPYNYHMLGMKQATLKSLKTFLSTFYADDRIDYDSIFGDFDPDDYNGIIGNIADLLVSTHSALDPVNIGIIYACGGHKDKALDQLEIAYAERNPNLVFILNPVFIILKDEDRYIDLCGKMNIPITGNVFGSVE